MYPRILVFGLIAGLLVATPMVVLMLVWPSDHGPPGGVYYGYTAMLVALSMVFLGVKQHRDKALGGVIRFLPALAIGIGISAVASVIYAAGWELSLALTGLDFAEQYSRQMIERWTAEGLPADEMAKRVAKMKAFATMYANPAYRIPITILEMFPVGVLVSLVSAGLLRNSRFLPAKI